MTKEKGSRNILAVEVSVVEPGNKRAERLTAWSRYGKQGGENSLNYGWL